MRSPSNKDIADILDEIGLMLEAEGVAFKPEAYAEAAATVRGLDEEVVKMHRACGPKCLDALPGIGKSIADKIGELARTGHLKEYETLKRRYPFDIRDLVRVEGVGAKTAMKLYKALGVRSLDDLEEAAKAGRIARLPRFGEKSQARLLRSIAFQRKASGRILLHRAVAVAEGLVEAMRATGTVKEIAFAGSARRMQETCGDIDLVATAPDIKKALAAMRNLPQVGKLIEEWPDRTFVRLKNGLDADLIVLEPGRFGSLLLHFTGDKAHNIKLRTLAKRRGLLLNEYGLFKGKKLVAGRTEDEVYQALRLQTPPPEIRTDAGEIEAAKAGTLPKLVGYGDIRGDLQVQTDWTDGAASIEEMAKAAKARGLDYIAVTDHTKTQAMMGGLDEKALARQGKEIDALNAKSRGFRILKSTECDILKDGRLDLSDAALKALDLVCVSVHLHRNLPEEEMTARVIRALKHPSVNILFHPTGRIVTRRDAYAIDMGKVIRAAKQYGVALEVNASDRLDLKDAYVRKAMEVGAKLVVDSDAHRPEEFDFLRFGIGTARRGWATKADVLNTRPADAFLKALRGLKRT